MARQSSTSPAPGSSTAEEIPLEVRRARLRAQHAKITRERVRRARFDYNTFAQYVLRDEETNLPIMQAPHHRAWHNLIDKHKNVVIWAHVESGKTNNVSIGRVLWEIGRDPTLRVAIVSSVHGQAKKVLSAIRKNIEENPRLRVVFPNLVKGDRVGDLWTETAITVKRDTIAKDPTVQVFGIAGKIVGSRVDLLILDDVLTFDNTLTQEQREKTWRWLQSNLPGRLTARSRVWVVGTAFHPQDALHRYAALPGYHAVRYPIVENEQAPPSEWIPRWPERFPIERILQKKATMTPAEFERQLLCIARDDASAKFKRDWVATALERGRGRRLAWALKSVPAGCATITGVDLAVQKGDGNDLTAFFTILRRPNGDRELLWVEAGRWSGPEIVEKVMDHHRRYLSIVVVENNAAQDYIVQFTKEMSDVPVRGFTTGKNKASPEFGIESMATEFANGKWIIPNELDEDGNLVIDPEVEAWISEVLGYDPKSHTGDRLMASWFAREGVRMTGIKSEVGNLNLRTR
jgi:hypothetical protein